MNLSVTGRPARAIQKRSRHLGLLRDRLFKACHQGKERDRMMEERERAMAKMASTVLAGVRAMGARVLIGVFAMVLRGRLICVLRIVRLVVELVHASDRAGGLRKGLHRQSEGENRN